MGLNWGSWKARAFWARQCPVPRNLPAECTRVSLSSMHRCPLRVTLGDTGPLEGLEKNGPTGSPVRSLWPPAGLYRVLGHKRLVSSAAVGPGVAGAWGLAVQPFWKKLCSQAPVAGVQMLPEDLDFLFNKKRKERAEESLASVWWTRGSGLGRAGERQAVPGRM